MNLRHYLFLLIAFIHIVIVIYGIWQFNKYKKYVVFGDNGDHRLFTHSYKTLKNGRNNLAGFLTFYLCGLPFLFIPYELLHLIDAPLILLWLYSLFSISSNSYKASEVKHLVDGISTTFESDNFFKTYASVGMITTILNLLAFLLLPFTAIMLFSLIFSFILIFLLGMGDLLQVTDINRFKGRTSLIKEPILNFIEPPIHILKALFIKNKRNEFLRTLRWNLKNIYLGCKKLFLSLQ